MWHRAKALELISFCISLVEGSSSRANGNAISQILKILICGRVSICNLDVRELFLDPVDYRLWLRKWERNEQVLGSLIWTSSHGRLYEGR